MPEINATQSGIELGFFLQKNYNVQAHTFTIWLSGSCRGTGKKGWTRAKPAKERRATVLQKRPTCKDLQETVKNSSLWTCLGHQLQRPGHFPQRSWFQWNLFGEKPNWLFKGWWHVKAILCTSKKLCSFMSTSLDFQKWPSNIGNLKFHLIHQRFMDQPVNVQPCRTATRSASFLT